MATLYGLDMLARFAPQIFGRALSLDGVMVSLIASSGRHDHIDSHTQEMRAALDALSLLSRLASVPDTRQAAQVLAYTHVVCGEAARQQADTWLAVGLQCSGSQRAAASLSPERKSKYIVKGLELYTQASSLWRRL